MALEILTAPSFPQLERHLLQVLTGKPDRGDPLTPRWVVVPTSLLVRHLRLKLARVSGHGAVGAVRVIHIRHLVDRLAPTYGLPEGRSCDSELELILTDLLAGLPDDHPLAEGKGPTAAAAGLRKTFQSLADAGFSASDSVLLQEAVKAVELPSLVEIATIELYGRFAASVEQCGLPWQPFVASRLADRIEEAGHVQLRRALCCEEDQTPLVCFYGFYEWIDVHAKITTALARNLERVLLFYPSFRQNGDLHPCFEFTRAVLDDLRARMRSLPETTQPLPRSESENTPSEQFFLSTFPEGHIGSDKPDFIEHGKASGLRAEVVSAAVNVREALDRGLSPEEIMVLAPDVEDYRADVSEIFSSFAIPFRILSGEDPASPESAPFEALARLWEDRAPADWVLHYLRTVPAKKVPALEGVDPEGFESTVRKLGLWGGRSWLEVLKAHSKERHSGPSDRPRFNKPELGFIRRLHAFWVEEPEHTQDHSLEEAKTRFRRIGEEWFSDSQALKGVTYSLERLGAILGDRKIPQWVLIGLLKNLAEPAWGPEEAAEPEDPTGSEDFAAQTAGPAPDPTDLNRKGVLVAPLMRARGVTASKIVLMGLDADRFPRRMDEDPFLADATRQKLAGAARDLGHRLATRSQITDEMALLFHLVNTSAGQMTWIVPVADAAGKSVAPSPWIQRYLDSWPAPPPNRKQVPRSPMEQARHLLDHGEPPTHPFLPPEFGALIGSGAANALDDAKDLLEIRKALSLRAGEREHWNGVQKSVEPLRPQGVTSLEKLARCPYLFYAESIAGLAALRPLGFVGSMDAMLFGSIAHKILERSIKDVLDLNNSLVALRDRILEAVDRQIPLVEADFLVELAVLPELLRRAEMGRIKKWVKTYVSQLGRENLPDGSPRALEMWASADHGMLTVKGKIDRVDLRLETTVLLDYKTGSPRGRSNLQKQVRAGWLLQPSLYPWLYRKNNPEISSADFSIIYLKTAEEVSLEPSDAEDLLDQLQEIIANSAFVPTPGSLWKRWGKYDFQPCRYCDLTSVCRRLDPGAVQRYGTIFQKLAPKRAHALRPEEPTNGSGIR